MMRANDLISRVTQGLAAGAAAYRATAGRWSVYDKDWRAVVTFDTFFSVDAKNEGKVTQAPVEKGSFVSYNKTVDPVRSTVVLGYTGRADVRRAIIEKCEKLLDGTELVSIITPDRTLVDMAVVSFDYTYKAANGVDRLLVALALEQVRQVEPAYTDEQVSSGNKQPMNKGTTKQASDANTANNGKQQPKETRVSSLERARRGVKSWR